MKDELLQKMQQHAAHNCQIAQSILQMYSCTHKNEHPERGDFLNALDALAEAVATLHLDSDAKVTMLMNAEGATQKALRYLAASFDDLARRVSPEGDRGQRIPRLGDSELN